MQNPNLIHTPVINYPLGEGVVKNGKFFIQFALKGKSELMDLKDLIDLYGPEAWAYLHS